MKIFWCSSFLTFALWHLGCEGSRVGAPKQQEGGLSNEKASYNNKAHIRDDTKSFVRIAVHAPNLNIASSNSNNPHRLSHSVSRCDPILRWKVTPSQTGTER
jgi:hypothetical protein